jgi:hypothetical protein
VMAVVVGLLCLFSAIFIPKTISNTNSHVIEKVNPTAPQQQAPPPGGGTQPAGRP